MPRQRCSRGTASRTTEKRQRRYTTEWYSCPCRWCASCRRSWTSVLYTGHSFWRLPRRPWVEQRRISTSPNIRPEHWRSCCFGYSFHASAHHATPNLSGFYGSIPEEYQSFGIKWIQQVGYYSLNLIKWFCYNNLVFRFSGYLAAHRIQCQLNQINEHVFPALK